MIFSNPVLQPHIQHTKNKQIETVKEYTSICQMESLQGPKEHWQCKQSKSYTS